MFFFFFEFATETDEVERLMAMWQWANMYPKRVSRLRLPLSSNRGTRPHSHGLLQEEG